MQIDLAMIDEGPSVYYEAGFRAVIESHLTYLRTHPDTNILAVDPNQVYRFEFDFYGLLNYYNVPSKLHWTVLRVNDLISPQEFPSDLGQILLPSLATVEMILQIYRTT